MSSHEVRLLLVDDDPCAIQVMGRMLAQYPNQRFATSGEAAIRLAREATPDLILLDVEMPGMTGFDVCKVLKSDPLLAQVPVIFATSHDSAEMQVAALGKGGADFVSKPVVAAQLNARVRTQLRAKRLAEDLRRDGLASKLARQPSQQTPRVLIVDDDIASVHILRHTLATMGEFHFAINGEQALQLARRMVPDLILLDAHMPGVDGFDVCRSLKAEQAFRHVPIVFVTRFSDPLYEMRALDLGAADFIAKPYTPAVLQARIRNLLDLKQRTDAELEAVGAHWRQVSDARITDIVDAASDAIVTYRADQKIVLINAAACRMFEVDQRQAMGTPARALLGERVVGGGLGHGGPARTTIARASEPGMPVEISVSTVGEGADRLTTVMLRDVSDRDRLEAESRSRAEAEAASRTKTQMMTYLAHEMGNPLSGLLGFAQLMVADAGHPLPAPQAARLAHVVTSGHQLQGLMRDVMELGRFETGKLVIDMRAVDAARCAQDAAAAVSALAEQAGVALACAPALPPLWVAADAERLHQCLVNLLTNAIKYQRGGGWVRIELNADAEAPGIAVRDNGIGMDAQQLEHLFEPFNRLGRQRAAAPGTGLGLVITRQLVEAMGGQLHVASEPGQGSCFTIALSGAPSSAPSNAPSNAPSHTPSSGPRSAPDIAQPDAAGHTSDRATPS